MRIDVRANGGDLFLILIRQRALLTDQACEHECLDDAIDFVGASERIDIAQAFLQFVIETQHRRNVYGSAR